MVGWKMAGWQIGTFKPGHTIEEYIPDPKEVIDHAKVFYSQHKDDLYWENKNRGERRWLTIQ
jgi:hypothetical protein